MKKEILNRKNYSCLGSTRSLFGSKYYLEGSKGSTHAHRELLLSIISKAPGPVPTIVTGTPVASSTLTRKSLAS